jgi:ubiquinone/menaquinone biosynthesis C-methylase UbiE
MNRGAARACPETSYQEALAAEKSIYGNCVDVHHLPPIFHYWSNRHLVPKLQPFGFSSPAGMFAKNLRGKGLRILSLGAGNCDLEIQLAQNLEDEFHLDCVDLNPAMLERGRIAAGQAGVSLNFIQADLNHWSAEAGYDAVIANQFLHHVVNLEGLFDQVKRSLRPGGQFLISDMIGRNGHQRWPEALEVIHEFWRKLPPSYRFNQLVGYYEEMYQSWDCSVQGFEGIRSQDILPLLLEQFHFRLFVAYGNVIDPFIDRAFGGHFDPAAEWDRNFIDQVHQRDEEELASGRLKPTHMIAVLTHEPGARFGNFEPESCVRRLTTPGLVSTPGNPYDWNAWPHDTRRELEIACQRIAGAGREIRQRTEWALGLAAQLEEKTAWALSLEQDVRDFKAWALSIEKELEHRTAWASSLQADVEQRTGLALRLQQEVAALELLVEERTLWALRVKQELAEQTLRAERLERELYDLTHKPMYFLRRVLKRLLKLIM